jgi:hypothetical protein
MCLLDDSCKYVAYWTSLICLSSKA